jgi:NADPH2:quinone reductase
MAVGGAVTHFAAGDRVLASLEHGGLAEQAVAHQDNVYPIPALMPFPVATTLNASYNSVAAALIWPHLLNVQRGQTLLILGGAGNVGIAAIQIGLRLGATVIAAASTHAKRTRALAEGAHHVVDAEPAVLRDEVFRVNGGRPVDRALDPVGGDVFAQVLRCLAPEGRVVPLGFASGKIPDIPANVLLVKNIAVCGLYMGYYKIDARSAHVPRMRDLFHELGRWWEDGSIRPAIAGCHSLDHASQAFAQVLARESIGHVVIEFR